MSIDTICSRRDFLERGFKAVKTIGGVYVASQIFSLELFADEVKINPTFIRKQADNLWKNKKYGEAIGLYMTLTPEQILGNDVEYVRYNKKTRTNNYNQVVKQENVKDVTKRKPALELIFENDGVVSRRDAILLLGILRVFNNKLSYVAYECDEDPQLAANNYKLLYQQYDIKDIPSLKLYSFYDVIEKETKKKEGLIKCVDILRSGPKADRFILPWLNFLHKWIKTNITEPNGKWAYRFNNSWNEKKVKYKI